MPLADGNWEYSEVRRRNLPGTIGEGRQMDGHIAERSPDPPLRPAAQRYAAAVAWVGAGLLTSLWMQGVMDDTVPLLIAVLMAAWFNGLWPALLASLLAVVADDYFFTVPLYTVTPELSHVPHLTAFVLLAV